MKTRIMRKIIKQIKVFYSLSDSIPALKFRMTAFKSPVFCLMYKTRIMRKMIKQLKGFYSLSKQIKGFYSLSDSTPALKCRMTEFKSPVLCSIYFLSLFFPLYLFHPLIIWPTYDSNSIICRSSLLLFGSVHFP